MAQMKLNVGIKGWKTKNILELSVPKELDRTVRTGVKFVDDLLGGSGFTPSTSTMLTGTPGAGKTTMLLQLADSLTGLGHIVVFNTAEESLYQVRKTARRIGLKHGFYADQETHIPSLLKTVKALQKQAKGKKTKKGEPVQVFLFVDSLQCMDDGKYADGAINGQTQVRVTELLTNWAKDTYGIVVFIGHVTKGGQFAGKNQVKHAVDCHMHLYVEERSNDELFGERILEAQKNRFGCNGTKMIVGLASDGMYKKGEFSWA
jgi:DNA repair protein RadA/Sms